MPTVRKLTADNDLEYVAGRQATVSGKAAIAQSVKVCILHVEGENPFFPTLGIDLLAIGSSSIDEKKQALRKALIRSGRIRVIVDITHVETEAKTRRAKFRARCILRNGQEFVAGVEL